MSNGSPFPVVLANLPVEWEAVVVAILEGPAAWSSTGSLLDAGHDAVALEEMACVGLIERWELPGGPAWTLTPYGAWLAKARLEEHPDGTLAWIGAHIPERQVRLPRHPREERLPFPELVPDPAPGPEYMVDAVSEEPVKLFQRDGKGGWPVLIDPRLGRVRRKRGKRVGV